MSQGLSNVPLTTKRRSHSSTPTESVAHERRLSLITFLDCTSERSRKVMTVHLLVSTLTIVLQTAFKLV